MDCTPLAVMKLSAQPAKTCRPKKVPGVARAASALATGFSLAASQLHASPPSSRKSKRSRSLFSRVVGLFQKSKPAAVVTEETSREKLHEILKVSAVDDAAVKEAAEPTPMEDVDPHVVRRDRAQAAAYEPIIQASGCTNDGVESPSRESTSSNDAGAKDEGSSKAESPDSQKSNTSSEDSPVESPRTSLDSSSTTSEEKTPKPFEEMIKQRYQKKLDLMKEECDTKLGKLKGKCWGYVDLFYQTAGERGRALDRAELAEDELAKTQATLAELLEQMTTVREKNALTRAATAESTVTKLQEALHRAGTQLQTMGNVMDTLQAENKNLSTRCDALTRVIKPELLTQPSEAEVVANERAKKAEDKLAHAQETLDIVLYAPRKVAQKKAFDRASKAEFAQAEAEATLAEMTWALEKTSDECDKLSVLRDSRCVERERDALRLLFNSAVSFDTRTVEWQRRRIAGLERQVDYLKDLSDKPKIDNLLRENAELESDLEDCENSREHWENEAEQRDETLLELEKKVEEVDATIEERDTTLKERDATIVERDARILELENRLAARHPQVNESRPAAAANLFSFGEQAKKPEDKTKSTGYGFNPRAVKPEDKVKAEDFDFGDFGFKKPTDKPGEKAQGSNFNSNTSTKKPDVPPTPFKFNSAPVPKKSETPHRPHGPPAIPNSKPTPSPKKPDAPLPSRGPPMMEMLFRISELEAERNALKTQCTDHEKEIARLRALPDIYDFNDMIRENSGQMSKIRDLEDEITRLESLPEICDKNEVLRENSALNDQIRSLDIQLGNLQYEFLVANQGLDDLEAVNREVVGEQVALQRSLRLAGRKSDQWRNDFARLNRKAVKKIRLLRSRARKTNVKIALKIKSGKLRMTRWRFGVSRL